MYYISAQLWKISGTKLINKDLQLRNQEQSNKDWKIPSSGTDGNLEETGRGKIIGIRQKTDCRFGPKTALQKRGAKYFDCPPVSDSQRWLRSDNSSDGWFTLENQANGLFLTSIRKDQYELKGKLIFLQR